MRRAGSAQFLFAVAHPYEVVHYSLESAVVRRRRLARIVATLTEDSVSGEIQAVRDAGLTYGWYLWNPSNRYRPASCGGNG